MVPPPGFVDLHRRFIRLGNEVLSEDAAVESYTWAKHWLFRESFVGWDDLLKHRLVVILGEPGSGKTYEMRNQAAQPAKTPFTFFVRLDELVDAGQNLPVPEEDHRRFQQWRQSQSEGVFFLDSVDEAKINQTADFYRALDRFRDSLGGENLRRSTIVISSRITEWLPATDAYEVRARFQSKNLAGSLSNPSDDKKAEPVPLVVQLLPLEEENVAVYAEARGHKDVPQFLNAIEQGYAWELARRPADVDDLFSFWQENHSLGSLTEILEFVCERQLRKTSDRERKELISSERARSGAECLAAATVLCRKFTFQIPGETLISNNALDAMSYLPVDWRPEEVRALFNRAVFDGASYGRIRFHHRRLSEYLASCCLQRLLQIGCPISEVEQLLFDTDGKQRTLRPSTAPLAAWLCAGADTWNRNILNWVLEASPETLLRYGDGTRLTLEDRRRLFRALLNKAGQRDRLWWERDKAALTRLAHPELAPDINTLLRSTTLGSSLREFLLEIVSAGNIAECSQAVLEVAISDLESGDFFPDAADALGKIGKEHELQELAKTSSTIKHFRERVCIPLCQLLFPSLWNANDLVQALSRMQGATHGGHGWDYVLAERLKSVSDGPLGLSLIRAFIHAGTNQSEHDPELSDELQWPWTLRLAAAVAIGMLNQAHLSWDESHAAAEVLVRTGSRHLHLSKETDINALCKKHPLVRRFYFEIAARKVQRTHDCKNPNLSTISIFYDSLKAELSDIDWINSSIQDLASIHEKQRAVIWSLELHDRFSLPRSSLAKTRLAAKPFPELRASLSHNHLAKLQIGLRRFWHWKIKEFYYRYQRKWTWKRVANWWRTVKDDWKLWLHRRKLTSGEYGGWVANLAVEAMYLGNKGYTVSDWSGLEQKRGVKCAKAARDGCKAIWRSYTPPFPHQKPSNEGASYRTIAGLSGIMAALTDGELKLSKLSKEDAMLIARYALNELNGFAPWMTELAHTQPDAVRTVLAECVENEWNSPADKAQHHFTLNDLAWSRTDVAHLVKSDILNRLKVGEPSNASILSSALRILLDPPCPSKEELAALARARIQQMHVSSSGLSFWMVLWLQADALPAIDYLENELPTVAKSSLIVVGICSLLSGRRGETLRLLDDPAWLSPAAMQRFLPLIYTYVRPDEDIHRPSGGDGYTPSKRDYAQEFRGGILEKFVNTQAVGTGAVLRYFLQEPLLSHSQDYIHHLLEQHAEHLANAPAWSTRDVRAFMSDYERVPKTDADLFRLACNRLKDIKAWVETGEDSPREEVSAQGKEEGFRRWLHRRMNDRAKERYKCVQEWELDGKVRPDLRLVIPGAAPVTLELKIYDEWTLPQLIAGLESQLVGKYLRDANARFGIYVLATFNRLIKKESFDRKSLLDCNNVLDELQTKAKAILSIHADVAGLQVIMIHFSLK